MEHRTVKRREQPNDPLTIDPSKLDEEVLEHCHRVRRSGEELAKANREVARAEGRFKLVRAKLRVRIRTDPQTFDLPAKPAMDLVDACVETQREYQEAHEELVRITYERDCAQAERQAFWDRKDMINNAVKLQLSGDLPTRMPGEMREQVQERLREKVRKPIRR